MVDVLTDALRSMRTGRPSSVRTDAHAPWALRFGAIAGAGVHVVLQGTCWLIPPGTEPIALGPGDVVFLRTGREHILADSPSSPVEDFLPERVEHTSPIGRIKVDGPGPGTSLLCGAYQLDRAHPHPVLKTLPEVVHLPERRGRHSGLRATVELLGSELEEPRPGSDGIVPALIDALLLYILRAWLDDHPERWSQALNDAGIARTLYAIHQQPGRGWTVAELASEAGLSRAAFARRFGALIGEPPLAYLTRWRMTTAARLLAESHEPLKNVAAETGYSNEFAFAKAFKREFNIPPGEYRRRGRAPNRVNRSASPDPLTAAPVIKNHRCPWM